eukprot:TRINITY_DN3566_c0_g1_i1.p1 TRINITY_DN3566_c0_g1~~TRINITY_DN3566_c0_g1_i1.p1  ORF type:complete len:516 (+),score=95.39 TRINITY_DN3566_c0_g1_i1:31-1548(+)
MTNDEIDGWLLKHCGVLVVDKQFFSTTRKAYSIENDERQVIFQVTPSRERGLITGTGFHFMDRELLADAIYDFVMQKIVQKVLTSSDVNYHTVGSYAVIDWGDTPRLTGGLLRQTITTNRVQSCSLNTIWDMEKLMRKYGLTSSFFDPINYLTDSYVLRMHCAGENRLVDFTSWMIRNNITLPVVLESQVQEFGKKCSTPTAASIGADQSLPPFFVPAGDQFEVECFGLTNWRYHDKTAAVNVKEDALLWKTINECINDPTKGCDWWEPLKSLDEMWTQCEQSKEIQIAIDFTMEDTDAIVDSQQQAWFANESWYKVAQSGTKKWFEEVQKRDHYDVAACSVIKDEPIYLLQEFVVRGVLAGVQHFEFLDQSSDDVIEATHRALSELIDAGLVSHSRINTFGRRPCKLWNKTEWLALIDPDEYITLTDYSHNLHSFLSNKKFERAGAVALHWKYVFSNCHTRYHDTTHTVTAQFPYYCATSSHNGETKSIVRAKQDPVSYDICFF